MSRMILPPEQQIRQRARWFELAAELGNVTIACARCEILPKTYHKWRKRFTEARSARQALLDRSRRPHRPRRRVTHGPTRDGRDQQRAREGPGATRVLGRATRKLRRLAGRGAQREGHRRSERQSGAGRGDVQNDPSGGHLHAGAAREPPRAARGHRVVRRRRRGPPRAEGLEQDGGGRGEEPSAGGRPEARAARAIAAAAGVEFFPPVLDVAPVPGDRVPPARRRGEVVIRDVIRDVGAGTT
jgi:hypothetical protein